MEAVLNEVKDIGAFLKENGIKPSYQRMQIYKFLLENRIHPTVDTIYKALCVLNEVKDIGAFLKENGIKPSYQRMQIYKFLLENRIHPTVDTIYKALCDEIPTLSKNANI